MKLQNVARAALRPAYDDLAARLPDQASLNIDESPTKQANIKAWVWAFVVGTFTVFTIRRNISTQWARKADPLHELLGEAFRGIVGCDRAKMYHSLGQVQWCRAHLIRDMQGWIDSPDGSAKQLGRDLLRQVAPMFRMWWQVRDGTLSRVEFQTRMQRVRQEVRALLLRGGDARTWSAPRAPNCSSTKTACGSSSIARRASRGRGGHRADEQRRGTRAPAGGDPAQTDVRHAKRSGHPLRRNNATVLETCRQQARSPYAFVTATLQARYRGTATPTLNGV